MTDLDRKLEIYGELTVKVGLNLRAGQRLLIIGPVASGGLSLEAAPLVTEMLTAAPRLSVLVTSRAALHLYGEHEYVVPPLALPDPKRLPPLERLSQYEAVRLFIARAQAAKADFAITNENAPARVGRTRMAASSSTYRSAATLGGRVAPSIGRTPSASK